MRRVRRCVAEIARFVSLSLSLASLPLSSHAVRPILLSHGCLHVARGHLSPLSAAPPAHGALPACSSSHVWEAVLWHLLCSAASDGRAALLSTPPSAIRLLCSLLVEKERAESVRPAMRRVWESGVSELGPLVALSRVERPPWHMQVHGGPMHKCAVVSALTSC